MKIAIATDDRINIAQHTGRAAEFAIFAIENGTVVNTEYLKNDHTHHDHHHEHGDLKHGHDHNCENHDHHGSNSPHANIVKQMKGVDLFLVTHLGPHFRVEVEAAGIEYKSVRYNSIEELLKEYLA